ncbi:alpha/beta fold hydrolase BchO [Shimia ponticola]|uniref:alpha/beta fold hydrolase BchO n=1 Tax=Shimia ponticola TaxID=2582893 RepID=UPI0011BE5892|nr:alpha/beta fold hydrolase BchO [Shimia ponticola]
MDWGKHKAHWPHADHSRFVPAGTGRWHVQEMGQGPTLLLIHGAGGATQSWRHLMPLLSRTHRVIAIDLPGQGFSKPRAPGRFGLDQMARDLWDLMQGQGWEPKAIIGHSAGAAVALRVSELARPAPWKVIGLNAALAPFKGVAGWAFPMAAKAMALNPLTAPMVAATSNKQSVTRILDSTGSKLDDDGLALYARLVGSASHVNGTLRMMANWSLDGLLNRLPQNTVETVLIVGENDGTVPAGTSDAAAARMPNAHVLRLPNLGHLAHEEAPETVLEAVLSEL